MSRMTRDRMQRTPGELQMHVLYIERGCRILDHSAAPPCMIRWRSNASFVRSVVSAMPAWPEALPAPFIVRASARKRWFSTRFLMEGSNLRLSSNGIIQGRPILSASGANFFHWKGGMTLVSPYAPPFGCRADARPARGGCPSRGSGRGHYSTIARGTGAVHLGTRLSAQSRIWSHARSTSFSGRGSFLVNHAVRRQRLRIAQKRV
jgi:hypothetical protein